MSLPLRTRTTRDGMATEKYVEWPRHGDTVVVTFSMKGEEWQTHACFKCYGEVVAKLAYQHGQDGIGGDHG